MKILILNVILILIPVFVVAQVKPPEIETDIVTAFFDYPVSFNALANDYSYEGDSLIIWIVSDVWNGEAYCEDSIIYYTPGNHQALHLSDTVYYIIKDVTTGLYSDEGKAIINFERIKSEQLDINNINAQINCGGNQFRTLNYYNPYTFNFGFEAPKGGGVPSIFNSTLWLGGMDENNNIHTACERNRTGRYVYASQIGYDFWPGPIVDSSNYNVDYLFEHNRVWKIEREEINYHKFNYDNPGYSIPDNILNWPAHGDIGTGAAQILAPFVDVNNNQVYEPELGDYPAVKGDYSLSFYFNDDFARHTESFGRKLGVDVFGQAFAFDCPEDSAFFNTIFMSYQIINRSDTNYFDFYVGNYTNLMIGNAGDDLLVCDTVFDAFYAFNEDAFDDTTSSYYPGYMHHPPAQAVVFLNNKMDHCIYSKGFYYPPNDSAFDEDPTEANEYYNYMKSIWPDSTHLTYGGNGHLGLQPTNFAFTGDPISNEGWTHQNSGVEYHGLHAIASSGPYDFMSGDTITLELAYVFARDYEGDHLSSVVKLQEHVERVRWFYENDSTPCGSTWSGLNNVNASNDRFNIYPNPATSQIFVDISSHSELLQYQILNFIGQVVDKGIVESTEAINIENLNPGYYILQCKLQTSMLSSKFVKLQ